MGSFGWNKPNILNPLFHKIEVSIVQEDGTKFLIHFVYCDIYGRIKQM